MDWRFAVTSSPATLTLTRLLGQGFTGELRGTGPESTCHPALACWGPFLILLPIARSGSV